MKEAIKNWTIKNIVMSANDETTSDDDSMDTFSQTTMMKCLCLSNAYEEALDQMDKGWSFGRCSETVIKNLASVGINFSTEKILS